MPTPGHTADSLCFHLPADRAVLTGDTMLGRGTTVVAHPDGRLGDYLDSLRRLRSLDGRRRRAHRAAGPRAGAGGRPGRRRVLPRPPRPPPRPGRDRRRGRATARRAEVVAHVYADVDRSLWPAAELSVRAQLEYLREHGLI